MTREREGEWLRNTDMEGASRCAAALGLADAASRVREASSGPGGGRIRRARAQAFLVLQRPRPPEGWRPGRGGTVSHEREMIDGVYAGHPHAATVRGRPSYRKAVRAVRAGVLVCAG